MTNLIEEIRQVSIEEPLTATHSIYSLLDRKAGVLGTPFISDNDLTSKRIVLDLLTLGGENLISTHPSDFDLVRIGTFSNRSGILDSYSFVLIENCENLLEYYRTSLRNKTLVSTSENEENEVEPLTLT